MGKTENVLPLFHLKTSDMSEELEERKNNNGAFIGVIVVLVLGIGYLWYALSQTKTELETCNEANKELNADMTGLSDMMAGYSGNMSNDLKTDLRNMLDTYDKLKEKDATKADSINLQKEKIQGLLDQLNSNKKLSARQLYNMRKENETLRNIMKGYVKQIDSLNTLNLRLNSDLEERTMELNETSSQRDEYKTQAEQATEQVKKGSKLQAFQFQTVGLRMKLNNTPEETNKAKSTVMIRSTFTIVENVIATAGKKVVYMQIINPDGKTLQYKSSNTMQTDAGNIAYSDKKEIEYNNQSVDVAIFYNQEGLEYIKGTYKVKIYCDGQLIGTDSFTLK